MADDDLYLDERAGSELRAVILRLDMAEEGRAHVEKHRDLIADSHQCSRSFSLNVATYSQQSSHPLSAWQPPRSEATRLR